MNNISTYHKKVQQYLKKNNKIQIVHIIIFKTSTTQSKITTYAKMQENVTHKAGVSQRKQTSKWKRWWN